jgi:hypothetical protein
MIDFIYSACLGLMVAQSERRYTAERHKEQNLMSNDLVMLGGLIMPNGLPKKICISCGSATQPCCGH